MNERSRPLLVGLLSAAVLLSYVDRGTLPLAGPLITGEFGLSATAFGIAISAFFWVYAPAQLLCGWMVDRYSAYTLFGAGLALWGVATALTGLASGLFSLIALRLMLGLGQSFLFPGSSKLIAQHCTPDQRGSANGWVMAGLAVGQATGALIGGLIMAAYGWRTMCLVLGLVTLVWLIPWRLVRWANEPVAPLVPGQPQVSFAEILSKPALWSSAVAHFCGNYGFYFLISWLPLYLVKERGVSIALMAVLTAMTFAVQALSSIGFGWASDRMIRDGHDEARVRKLFMVIPNLFKAVSILAIALVSSPLAVGFWLFVVALTLGATSVQNFAIPQTFAGPAAAGRWVGVQNFGGNCAGIIGPIVTGMLIDATGNYSAAFMLAAAITLASALFWGPLLPRIAPIAWRSA